MKDTVVKRPGISLSEVIRSFRWATEVFRLLWETNPVWLVLLLALNVFAGVGVSLQVVLTKFVLDSLAAGRTLGLRSVVLGVCLYVGFTILRQVLASVQQYVQNLFQIDLSNSVNERVMAKAATLSLSQFEDAATYDMLQRVQRDSANRPYQVLEQTLAIIYSLVSVLSVASVLILWNWWLALLLLLVPFSSTLSYLSLNRLEYETQFKRAPTYRLLWYLGHLLTTDSYVKEIKLFQLEDLLIGRYRSLVRTFRDTDRGLAERRARVSLGYYLIGQIAVGGGLLLVAWNAFLGLLSAGSVAGCFQAIYSVQSSTEGLLRSLFAMYQNNLYVEQLFSFLRVEPGDAPSQPIGQLDGPLEQIEFRNVSFRYPGTQHDAVQDISFTLSRDEIVAIVGGNGSGKSTLVKLLAGLYTPTSGDILLNSRSISEFGSTELRKRMAVVLQDFTRYEFAARENVGFGDSSRIYDESALWEAAEQAGVDDVLIALPERLDTQLGRWFDGGVQLSGGEWQKVAIARAFFRHADVVMMDEPSAALDPIAEAEMFERFRSLVRSRFGLFISHRYSALRFASRILVLDAGKLVEYGTHADLVGQGGVYACLYQQQVQSYLGTGASICH